MAHQPADTYLFSILIRVGRVSTHTHIYIPRNLDGFKVFFFFFSSSHLEFEWENKRRHPKSCDLKPRKDLFWPPQPLLAHLPNPLWGGGGRKENKIFQPDWLVFTMQEPVQRAHPARSYRQPHTYNFPFFFFFFLGFLSNSLLFSFYTPRKKTEELHNVTRKCVYTGGGYLYRRRTRPIVASYTRS